MTITSESPARQRVTALRRRPSGISPATLLPPVLFFALFLGLWEGTVRVFAIRSLIMPAPSAVWTALVRGFGGGLYWEHIETTMTEALIGFVLGSASGIVFGVAVSQFRLLERMLMPFIVAFQSLPKIALAPLFVVWFGFGITSKLFVVYMLCFFPLLVNSIAGMNATDPERLELMRSFSATRWQTLTKVIFPGALPYVFAGFDMAIVYSLTGAVVGEFVGAQKGLGMMVMQTQYAMDIAGAFAVFVVLASLGVALSQGMQLVRRRVLFWAPSERRTVGT